MAGFGVLCRFRFMRAGQSKSRRVLGIVLIVALIGFFIKNFEEIMYMVSHPGEVVSAFLDDPIGFTVYMFFGLFLGINVGGA